MDKNFRTMVERSIQGIVTIQDFRIVYANQAFSKISGFSNKELIALTPAQVEKMIHDDRQDLVWGRMRSRLQGQKVVPRYKYKGVTKDGSINKRSSIQNTLPNPHANFPDHFRLFSNNHK